MHEISLQATELGKEVKWLLQVKGQKWNSQFNTQLEKHKEL